jgi:hypothetical protein
MKRTSKKTPTRFVPRVVFRTAFAGVVPLCVSAAACNTGDDSFAGVACIGFDGGPCGAPNDSGVDSGGMTGYVAAIGFDVRSPTLGDVASDAFGDQGPDISAVTVACIGFDGRPCGAPAPDAGDATFGDSSSDDAADAPGDG